MINSENEGAFLKSTLTKKTMIKTKVIEYIEKHPQAMPREIAKATGLTAKQINNVLYRYIRSQIW